MFLKKPLLLLAIVGVLAISSSAQKGQKETLPKPIFPNAETSKQPADYDLHLKTLDGKDFQLSQVRGKTIVINFWATWCPPCLKEMLGFQKLYEKLHREIVFIFISVDDSPQMVAKFFKTSEYSLPGYYLPGLKPKSTWDDFGKLLPPTYQSNSIPITFIISPQGYIVYQKRGGTDWYNRETITFLRSLGK